jgi:lipoyl(octanoyl) transferase
MQVRILGLTDYEATRRAMQDFTALRTPDTPDEMWITEHPPVYTLGLNRRDVRSPWRDDIPVVLTDRGGKITYHGPGQVVVYTLLDLTRRGLKVRWLVDQIEGAIIDQLAGHGIAAEGRANAPGVYVSGRKIASLGLRLKKGCCYHGLSLNVAPHAFSRALRRGPHALLPVRPDKSHSEVSAGCLATSIFRASPFGR